MKNISRILFGTPRQGLMSPPQLKVMLIGVKVNKFEFCVSWGKGKNKLFDD
jgi:hypothetical protein